MGAPNASGIRYKHDATSQPHQSHLHEVACRGCHERLFSSSLSSSEESGDVLDLPSELERPQKFQSSPPPSTAELGWNKVWPQCGGELEAHCCEFRFTLLAVGAAPLPPFLIPQSLTPSSIIPSQVRTRSFSTSSLSEQSTVRFPPLRS